MNSLAERVQLLRADEQAGSVVRLDDYQRDSWQIRGPAAERVKLPPLPCRAAGCDRKALRKYGLCHKHALRLIRCGTV